MTFQTCQRNQSASLTSSRVSYGTLTPVNPPRAAEHRPRRPSGTRRHYSRDTARTDVPPPPSALFVCLLKAEAIDYSNALSHGGTAVGPPAPPPRDGGGGGSAAFFPSEPAVSIRRLDRLALASGTFISGTFPSAQTPYTDHVSIISDTATKQL